MPVWSGPYPLPTLSSFPLPLDQKLYPPWPSLGFHQDFVLAGSFLWHTHPWEGQVACPLLFRSQLKCHLLRCPFQSPILKWAPAPSLSFIFLFLQSTYHHSKFLFACLICLHSSAIPLWYSESWLSCFSQYLPCPEQTMTLRRYLLNT